MLCGCHLFLSIDAASASNAQGRVCGVLQNSKSSYCQPVHEAVVDDDAPSISAYLEEDRALLDVVHPTVRLSRCFAQS
jgi:hypothetical protein